MREKRTETVDVWVQDDGYGILRLRRRDTIGEGGASTLNEKENCLQKKGGLWLLPRFDRLKRFSRSQGGRRRKRFRGRKGNPATFYHGRGG